MVNDLGGPLRFAILLRCGPVHPSVGGRFAGPTRLLISSKMRPTPPAEPVVSRNSNEAIGQCASRLLDDPRRLVSPYTPLQCPHRFSLFSCCS
jgi:hypothetical protein